MGAVEKLEHQIQQGSLAPSHQIHIHVNEHIRGHYLGMSGIGNQACQLWGSFHKKIKEEVDLRTLRIFRLGKILEEEIVQLIEAGGGEVTNRQTTMSDIGGLFCGHVDGVWEKYYILEIKTMKCSSWEKFLNAPTLRDYSIVYFSQVQIYMHYTGLRKSLIVGYNKDNSKVHVKGTSYNPTYAQFLINKAQSILTVTSPDQIPLKYRGESRCRFCELNCVNNRNGVTI